MTISATQTGRISRTLPLSRVEGAHARVTWTALSILGLLALQFVLLARGAFSQREITSVFRVNDSRNRSQAHPSSDFLEDGNIFSAWYEENPTSTGWDIKAKVFTPDGTPLTADLNVSETLGQHINPFVLPLESSGGAAVFWSNALGIWMHRFSDTYASEGSPSQVHAAGTDVSACAFDSGRFMVVWGGEGTHGIGRRVYRDDGSPDDIARQLRLPSGCAGRQGSSPTCISLPGGGGAAVHFHSTSTSCPGIFRAEIDIGGVQSVDAIEITGNRTACGVFNVGCLYHPQSVYIPGRGFVTAWYEKNSQWTSAIMGRFYSRDWVEQGAPFLAHNLTGEIDKRYLVGLSSGNLLVGWYANFGLNMKIISGIDGSQLGTIIPIHPGASVTSQLWLASKGGTIAAIWSGDTGAPYSHDIFAQTFTDNTPRLTTGTTGSTGSTGTTTGQPAFNSVSSPAAASSSPNSQLPLILSIALPALACLAFALTAGVLVRRRQSSPSLSSATVDMSTPITPGGAHGSLPPSRVESRTLIGDKYELHKYVRAHESVAAELQAQTGHVVAFRGEKKIEVCFGQGRGGKVRLARDVSDPDRPVFRAVKKVSGEEMELFGGEGGIGDMLRGLPNILETYDHVRSKGSDGRPKNYLFMFLASGDGEDLVESLGSFDRPTRALMVTQLGVGLARGLAESHGENVYHLDFKSENFVRSRRGEPYVSDWGTGCHLPDGMVRVGTTCDTRYASPERFACALEQRDYAAAPVDAWSLGVTLLELLIGAYPFDDTTQAVKFSTWNADYFRGKLSTIPELQDAQPGSLATVILGLLDTDPVTRLSVGAAKEALEMLLPEGAEALCAEKFAQLPVKSPVLPKQTTREYNAEREKHYNAATVEDAGQYFG